MQTNTVWFCLYKVPRRVIFIESESTLVDAKDLGGGRGNGELEFNGDRVLV